MERAQDVLSARITRFVGSAYDAAEGADALLVLTEWKEFYGLDLVRIRKLLRLPILLDGKRRQPVTCSGSRP
jgi:UDPglucose 6-dehydrogenase